MQRITTIKQVENAIKLNKNLVDFINENVEWIELIHNKICPTNLSILEKAQWVMDNGTCSEENLSEVWIDRSDVFILEEAYADHEDKTFISRVELNRDEYGMPETTLVSWYAGIPDDDATKYYYLQDHK